MLYLNCCYGFYVAPGLYNPDMRMAEPFTSLGEVKAVAEKENLPYFVAATAASAAQQEEVKQAHEEIRRFGWRPERRRRTGTR